MEWWGRRKHSWARVHRKPSCGGHELGIAYACGPRLRSWPPRSASLPATRLKMAHGHGLMPVHPCVSAVSATPRVGRPQNVSSRLRTERGSFYVAFRDRDPTCVAALPLPPKAWKSSDKGEPKWSHHCVYTDAGRRWHIPVTEAQRKRG